MECAIRTEYIELSQLLKLAGLCMTGGEAKYVIQSELVKHNGVIETRRSRKIRPGDTVEFQDEIIKVTQRKGR